MFDDTAGAQLWRMADLVTPMSIRVAATLRIADHLAAGTMDLDSLAHHTGADAKTLCRLMAHLTTIEVFAEPEPAKYALARLGERLVDDGPGGARSLLDIETYIGGKHVNAARLLEVVRSGRPLTDWWEEMEADSARSAAFDEQMAGLTTPTANAVAETFAWSDVEHVLDVGGGNGLWASVLMEVHPHLRVTVVDRPGPAASAVRRFAEAGQSDRGNAVAQSFFDPLPTGADVCLLSEVLLDWDDEHADQILGRCANALGESGCVLVLQPLLDHSDRGASTSLDVLLMLGGGRARSAAELSAMGAAHGLNLKSITSSTLTNSLVEFVRS
ncbi:MAG TPA: methyltransferase [Amycolatopsis sp.]|uniref:methyltransferase n=1 Tax=Amycolatopsis sp. TaxID=37632 RepID=UPI002C30803D|nr:methyltransferase [Amycolatopsis sp.]